MLTEADANAALLERVARRARCIGVSTPDRPEWHAMRSGLMTGSRIGAVAGLSPYESRYSTWARMAGYIDETRETSAMRWGNLLEPLVADEVERELGVALIRPVGTGVMRRARWAGANPDALHSELGVVEVKTTSDPYLFGSQKRDLSEPANDRIPGHYLAQMFWYMRVMGIYRGVLAALVAGNDLRYYAIEYDKREALRLWRLGLGFMESLAAGDMPDIDEHGATYQAIREMHPAIDGLTVELDVAMVAEAVEAARQTEAAAAAAAAARARIADAMGDAKYAELAGKRIADRRAKSGGTPYVQFSRKIHEIEVSV